LCFSDLIERVVGVVILQKNKKLWFFLKKELQTVDGSTSISPAQQFSYFQFQLAGIY